MAKTKPKLKQSWQNEHSSGWSSLPLYFWRSMDQRLIQRADGEPRQPWNVV